MLIYIWRVSAAGREMLKGREMMVSPGGKGKSRRTGNVDATGRKMLVPGGANFRPETLADRSETIKWSRGKLADFGQKHV